MAKTLDLDMDKKNYADYYKNFLESKEKSERKLNDYEKYEALIKIDPKDVKLHPYKYTSPEGLENLASQNIALRVKKVNENLERKRLGLSHFLPKLLPPLAIEFESVDFYPIKNIDPDDYERLRHIFLKRGYNIVENFRDNVA